MTENAGKVFYSAATAGVSALGMGIRGAAHVSSVAAEAIYSMAGAAGSVIGPKLCSAGHFGWQAAEAGVSAIGTGINGAGHVGYQAAETGVSAVGTGISGAGHVGCLAAKGVYSLAAFGVSAVGKGICGVGHISLQVTAEAAHLLSKAVIPFGLGLGAFVGYDAWACLNNKPPVWSTINACNFSTTLLQNIGSLGIPFDAERCNSYGKTFFTERMDQKISCEIFCCAALIIATPFLAIVCHKLGNLAKKVDRLYFNPINIDLDESHRPNSVFCKSTDTIDLKTTRE